jgi:hypothetical protein
MRPRDVLDEDPAGLIAKAGQLLTTMAFCRGQAEALHHCQQREQTCAHELRAFEACATDSASKVVGTLVQIAVKHCPDEVRAHQECKLRAGGRANCQREDLAAMWCASQVVMRTAAEETAALPPAPSK